MIQNGHTRTFSTASTVINSEPKPQLPVTQLVVLSICRFAEPVALTGVFPYLPEMIESFGIPHADVAYWAGVTSAVFSLSQCMTAITWGRASDKYGRKPVILLALFCAMSSSLFFGFSTSLRWAIVARALSGAANGNVGILRTVVAEIVPQKSLQPKAFSIMPLVWQIGAVVGPIFGGALANPVANMPEIFGGSTFFKRFPFALPNLANAVVFVVGLTTGILFLKESLETKKYRRDYGRILGSKLSSCCRGTKYKRLRQSEDFESYGDSNGRRKAEPLPPPSYREVFNSQSNLALLVYTILALHNVAYDQLLPVFMHMPTEENVQSETTWIKFSGGFGLESGRIGLIFSIYGISAMIMQFVVFPVVTARLGALYCMRACTLVLPITYFLTPYTVLMPSPTLQQLSLLTIMFVKAIAGVFAFPCITILLTNSAKSLRLLGTLNGVATSLSAIGRAAGPFLAGRTFTWGIENGYVTPAWWLLAAFAIPGHVLTWWLIESEGFGGFKESPRETDFISTTEATHKDLGSPLTLKTTEDYRDSIQMDDVHIGSAAQRITGSQAFLGESIARLGIISEGDDGDDERKKEVGGLSVGFDTDDDDDGDGVDNRPIEDRPLLRS